MIDTDERYRDVTPWDGLLLSVRIAATRVAEVEDHYYKLLDQHDGDQLDPDVDRAARRSRLERTQLARTSKAACDAGIAQRLVRNVEMESSILVRVTGRTFDDLTGELERAGIGAEVILALRRRIHATVHRELLAIAERDDAAAVPAAYPPPANPEVDAPGPYGNYGPADGQAPPAPAEPRTPFDIRPRSADQDATPAPSTDEDAPRESTTPRPPAGRTPPPASSPGRPPMSTSVTPPDDPSPAERRDQFDPWG